MTADATDTADLPAAGLIPAPLTYTPGPGAGPTLGPGAAFDAAPGTEGTARWLRAVLGLDTDGDGLPVRLALDSALAGGPEAYRLTVTADGVLITGGGPAGVFWGAQTLRRLAGPDAYRRAPLTAHSRRLPAVTVEDAPRFAWRGFMLDVSRHFLPKDGELRQLDLLAAHKLNVLHLHLTDDQGWRIEIPRHPELTATGAWRPRLALRGTATPRCGTNGRTAATTPRTTCGRSSRTRPSGTSPSSPRSNSPGTRRPPSPPVPGSATRDTAPPGCGPTGASARTCSPPPTRCCASTRRC